MKYFITPLKIFHRKHKTHHRKTRTKSHRISCRLTLRVKQINLKLNSTLQKSFNDHEKASEKEITWVDTSNYGRNYIKVQQQHQQSHFLIFKSTIKYKTDET
ncbi:CLUMA_CG000441, isoform A [Clunio marinus]|uniref:CLUMA_CG000441, isoform A n=1 Tax=Clunio marinus TaxID=568069 RepID=A0A1J1HFH9_9DIPT|nr:CLUMA_CG000441, isoform A [Clunio marinus]